MKIALGTLVGDASDLLGAHVAFHLAAGADVILVGGAQGGSVDLGRWEADGRVHLVAVSTHTELARIAVAKHGADWIVPSSANEFWWPRGESLKDVLAVMPARYGVVQGLVRTYAGARSPGSSFAEEMTARTSLLGAKGADAAPLEQLLRPVYRGEPVMVVDPNDWTLHGRRVPLRAWYPLEVLRFPKEPVIGTSAVEPGLADGTLVVDTRLRDVLRSLEASSGLVTPVAFSVPNVVDDASYAIECAAVGEVDLEGLDRQIRDLELRIAALEARLWPTIRRGLRRLARRPG